MISEGVAIVGDDFRYHPVPKADDRSISVQHYFHCQGIALLKPIICELLCICVYHYAVICGG